MVSLSCRQGCSFSCNTDSGKVLALTAFDKPTAVDIIISAAHVSVLRGITQLQAKASLACGFGSSFQVCAKYTVLFINVQISQLISVAGRYVCTAVHRPMIIRAFFHPIALAAEIIGKDVGICHICSIAPTVIFGQAKLCGQLTARDVDALGTLCIIGMQIIFCKQRDQGIKCGVIEGCENDLISNALDVIRCIAFRTAEIACVCLLRFGTVGQSQQDLMLAYRLFGIGYDRQANTRGAVEIALQGFCRVQLSRDRVARHNDRIRGQGLSIDGNVTLDILRRHKAVGFCLRFEEIQCLYSVIAALSLTREYKRTVHARCDTCGECHLHTKGIGQNVFTVRIGNTRNVDVITSGVCVGSQRERNVRHSRRVLCAVKDAHVFVIVCNHAACFKFGHGAIITV